MITMRALIRTGSPKVLTYDSNHPEPSSSESSDHYTIRTKATALTRGELTWPEPLIPDIPVPGYDLAGIVISTPSTSGPHAFKPGDEVYAFTYPFSGKGNAREITLANQKEMGLKPSSLTWEEAASVPLSALSAWQGLFVHGKLNAPGQGTNSGKRVLVTAASGGVGIFGVQFAHLAGTDVVGTCGTSNVDFVKTLGADTILDYRKTNLLNWVSEDRGTRGFDVILDCIGGETLTDAWKCARSGGRVISVAEPPEPKKPSEGVANGVDSVWFIVEGNGQQLAEVTKLIEKNRCRAVVDSIFELEQWEDAFARLEGGHAKGKVVLRLS